MDPEKIIPDPGGYGSEMNLKNDPDPDTDSKKIIADPQHCLSVLLDVCGHWFTFLYSSVEISVPDP
jgi:hypothetical protein